MSRSYASRSGPYIWRNVEQRPEFDALSCGGRQVYLRLVEEPRPRDSHVIALTIRRWSNSLPGMGVPEVKSALSELHDTGFIRVDWDYEEVEFIPAPRTVRKRPHIPTAIRRAVFSRDGRRCVLCGGTERLSLDHILRYRNGGPDTIDNLRVLCTPCNLERG